MIVVLKNANFANNNIGQIEVPIIWDANAKVFVDSLITPISDIRKRKINNLFIQLKGELIFNKLTHLYLPILGVDDGGKDIKGGAAITYPSASFETKGVRLTKGFRQSGFDRTNGSIGVYNNTAIDTNSGTLSVSLSFNSVDLDNPGTNPGRSAGRAIISTATQGGLTLGTPRVTITGELKSIGFVAVSTNLSLAKSHCLLSKTIGTGDFAFTVNESQAPIIGGLSINTNSGILAAPISCIFLGQYLTADELTELGRIVDNFMTDF